jgi:hypothetical protein
MPIVINEPIILTESQKKRFQSVTISRLSDDALMAKVIFHVVCPNSGAFIKEEILTYTGEDYNTFWENFNNGAYLYEELTKNLENIELPEGIENEFLNEVESEE